MHCGKIRLQKREADFIYIFFNRLGSMEHLGKNEILRPNETNNVY